MYCAIRITTTSLLSPIILSILQLVSYIEVQVDCVLRYKNNHHISYSFSNHSLYTSASELHRSISRLCIALLRITTVHISSSLFNHSLYTSASELHKYNKYRLYIVLPITTIFLSAIILSILQQVSYIEG